MIAINKVNEDPTGPSPTDMSSAQPVRGMTASAATPQAPVDLTTEEAKDSDALFYTGKGVLILWNAPDDPEGGEVTGYILARRTKMGTAAWSAWADDWGEISNASPDYLRTYYTDTESPEADEMREYRIKATSDPGNSGWSSILVYPADTSHAAVVTELDTPSLPRPRVFPSGGIKTISILWDSGEGEERQIVQLLTEDRMFVDSQTVMPDVESADFDNDGAGIAPGTYRVQIVALGTGTDFRNSGTVLVTVE